MGAAEGRGVALIAAITVAVAGWLYAQSPERGEASVVTGPADALYLPDDGRLGFVEVSGGPFIMGSDPGIDPRAYENERWSDSSLQGIVDLPAFYIGRHEVTVAQFGAFAAASGRRVDGDALRGPGDSPVGSISWPDALAYCRWLDAMLRESPQTPAELAARLDRGWRVSLPSEAQWEKAARGTDGRVFPWGDEPRRDRANYAGSKATPVGSFACPECPFGLSDMSGNVWELTRSPYRPYPFDVATENLDGIDLATDALWVMRGGSYNDPEQNVRTAIRGGADPGARRPFIGFRVVLTPPEP